MPQPVTLYDPFVRLSADMSNPNISEMQIPPHFTNIQHGLQLARKFLSAQDTPNRQVMIITDGLPTAHFEGEHAVFALPARPAHGERHAARGPALPPRGHHHQHLPAGKLEPDGGGRALRLPHRGVHAGRVFFTAGRELDRYVVWDYITRRKQIIA